MSIIYQPKGKAMEYSPWAANFYNGCSNKCEYCYNRHSQGKALLGKDEPTLKKSLIGDNDAVQKFKKECDKNIESLRKDGLFFSFVSDPCLSETLWVNWYAIAYCLEKRVPVTVLTKCTDWINEHPAYGILEAIRMNHDNIKIGFTLTGRDDLEQGASTNQERIYAMKRLKEEFDIYTWASIEPVIDISRSSTMIHDSISYCDEYRIGLLSGKKSYTPQEVERWMAVTEDFICNYNQKKLFWKESVLQYVKQGGKK